MWDYNEKVMKHFMEPQNVGEVEKADAVGEVGNITCGDALKLTLKINADGKIEEAKFKTFGCASAIASSSVLTEIVKGMTLDEAAKVTNQDIVDVLGELPEEKLHCSVMGMEALQAAIANYRGEIITQDDTEHEGRVVCKCFGITDTKIRKIIKDNNIRTTTGVTNYCKAGGACGTCLDDIHEIIEGVWKKQSESVTPENAQSAFSALSLVQKVIKIQEVIDKEIKPLLESDGGSIELADIRDNVIQVRLKGRCAVCPTSQVTLKHTVEGKLREFVSPELRVENI